jgi:hypothetical protein
MRRVLSWLKARWTTPAEEETVSWRVRALVSASNWGVLV